MLQTATVVLATVDTEITVGMAGMAGMVDMSVMVYKARVTKTLQDQKSQIARQNPQSMLMRRLCLMRCQNTVTNRQHHEQLENRARQMGN